MTSLGAILMTPAPASGARIEVRGLTKRFGDFTAVQDLDFAVEPGRITGFLGPNGAGKTTTLRMLLGLIRPTSRHRDDRRRRLPRHPEPPARGRVRPRVDELPPRPQWPRPPARAWRPPRAIPDRRVDEMLELVGIPAAARKRAGGYSMGMRQRLGLAAALLGDPKAVILDEPANGLDPEGIRWLRRLPAVPVRRGQDGPHLEPPARGGRADRRRRRHHRQRPQRGAGPDQRPAGRADGAGPHPATASELSSALLAAGVVSEEDGDTGLRVRTQDMARIGDVALRAGVAVHELRTLSTDLEALYFELTDVAREPQPQPRRLGFRTGCRTRRAQGATLSRG